MARHIAAKCKLCRREGAKLFLKGERCLGAKCAIEKRPKPPGVHSWRRGKPSDYGLRLRMKQKCKRYYGVLERQFQRYFAEANRHLGDTGEHLLQLLERRLDNVLTITGFMASRSEARQNVRHGHVTVNGRKVSIPSYVVEEGDVIRVGGNEGLLSRYQSNRELLGRPAPAWLEINDAEFSIRIMRLPNRQDVTLDVQELLIVEFCSR